MLFRARVRHIPPTCLKELWLLKDNAISDNQPAEPLYLGGVDNESALIIEINLASIAHLEEKDYFRLLSLQIAGQVAKWPFIKHSLNLPVSDNCRNFCRLLGRVANLQQVPILLIPHGWENLPDPRKQKFCDIFTITKRRGRIPNYKKAITVKW